MGKLLKRITSWSYSRLSDWVLCPLKAKLKHLDKLQEPKNDAMQRGGEIHIIAEEYVKGVSSAKLPAELKLFADLFKRLRALRKKSPAKVIIEDSWAFTKDWVACKWDDWAICWVRIKLDCAEFVKADELIVYDWKTGKFRDTEVAAYEEQLELYALGGFLKFPEVNTITPKLVYLDTSVVHGKRTYKRSELAALQKRWSKKVLPMLNDTAFRPTPNHFCKWCWFGQEGKKKGGPGVCQY